jgi:hypothetical protein
VLHEHGNRMRRGIVFPEYSLKEAGVIALDGLGREHSRMSHEIDGMENGISMPSSFVPEVFIDGLSILPPKLSTI